MAIDGAMLKRGQLLRRHLGSHGDLLLGELLIAADRKLYATVIILAAAVLDVMLREPTGSITHARPMDIAAVRDSRDVFWLRGRRNGIVHYESGRGGLMGDGDAVLMADASRALAIVTQAIEDLKTEN